MEENTDLLKEIQEKYVPFLKKLISFLEKTKKATPESISKLQSIYTVFTTSSAIEQIEVFYTNQKKLEKWYNSSQKDKQSNGATGKSLKRQIVTEDSDSSQGALEGDIKKPKKLEPVIVSVITVNTPTVRHNVRSGSFAKPQKTNLLEVTKISQDSQAKTSNLPSENSSISPDCSSEDDPVTFNCASCRFQTSSEQDFIKHTRTEHRSELSMWCKKCGKCFSNIGVLVTHIKERSCSDEEMVFTCGVKDCKFQTESGQSFVHHLRHCHKGSPFIFCIHCQKIFTLPHCLILHMQDECLYKARNRKSGTCREPSTVSAPVKPPVISQAVQPPPLQLPTISSVVSAYPKVASALGTQVPCQKVTAPPSRGGRGRGRGRARTRFGDSSSDSDFDADDPCWMPEENADSTSTRRSARWAKRISDVQNAEPKRKSYLSLSEINDKEMFKCPCCEFLAAFESVLKDHYIAEHKAANKNSCLVCNLKFESTALFVEHFSDHANGKLNNVVLKADVSCSINKPVEESVGKAAIPENGLLQKQNNISLDMKLFTDVVQDISKAKFINPAMNTAKIPYQAAIRGMFKSDVRIKRFEDLKSTKSLVTMKSIKSLCDFFKCVIFDCVFTTNDADAYSTHLLKFHHRVRTLYCSFCVKEFAAVKSLIQHMFSEHGKRQYQCSSCFYRAFSKIHVQIHIQQLHRFDKTAQVHTCDALEISSGIAVKNDTNEITESIWPFICGIGQCNFQAFDPNEFIEHNEKVHQGVTSYLCHYCKVDFLCLKRLLAHHRLHGLNNFQCNYCIHGSATKEEILVHLSANHPDQPLRAFMRGKAIENPPDTNVMPFPSELSNSDDSVSPEDDRMSENLLYEVVEDTYYPVHLHQIVCDFTCGVPWCQKKFDNMLSYPDHLEVVHSSSNFSCPHCPSVMETGVDFKDHLLCHGPELYRCGIEDCNFYHWNKTNVEKHFRKDHEELGNVTLHQIPRPQSDVKDVQLLPKFKLETISENPYECFFCRYKCQNKKIFKNHMYREMRYKRFSCNFCGNKFVSRKDISEHCYSKHSGIVKCSINANRTIEIMVKKLINGKIECPDPASTLCPVCLKKFKVFTQLQRHIVLCVQNQYEPYDCIYCGISVPDLKFLKIHVDLKHPGQLVSYTEISSEAVVSEIDKKLLQVRLPYLNLLLSQEKFPENPQNLEKAYVCSICSYESNHRSNTNAHMESDHSGICGSINKTYKNLEQGDVSPNVITESKNKCFQCGSCLRRFVSVCEVEDHVESQHAKSVDAQQQFFYNFFPDPIESFDIKDKGLYECGYCKSGRKNLHHLKKHFDLLHFALPFKVKCPVARLQTNTSGVLSCSLCFKRVFGWSKLEEHSTSKHHTLPVKAIGGYKGEVSGKESTSEAKKKEQKKTSLKVVKFSSGAFICDHCGAAFSTLNELTTHSRLSHRRLQVEYSRSTQEDLVYHKCEFCKFVCESKHMDTHVNTKHKMRVICVHCNKRFEFATKLKEHHNALHPGLNFKCVREVVGEDDASRQKSSSLDLSKIYTCHPNQESNRLTVLELSEICDIFPIVSLKRCVS